MINVIVIVSIYPMNFCVSSHGSDKQGAKLIVFHMKVKSFDFYKETQKKIRLNLKLIFKTKVKAVMI